MGGSKIVNSRLENCGRSLKGVGLRTLACWDRGFESRQKGGRLSCVSQCFVCVLSGKGLCEGPILRPAESYRQRALVCVCVCVRARAFY